MINISYTNMVRLVKENGAVILDVQLPNDFEKRHMIGSINIPLEQLAGRAKKAFPNLQTVLILCCQKGIRSMAGSVILEEMGYQNVYNLYNGFENGGF